MSNYYEYEDVKRAMVHRLFKMGWKVYGWSPDRSDAMTDYYDPEYWSGVAEKNGYILVVNDRFGQKEDRIYREHKTVVLDEEILEKIQKLEKVTVGHGATESEENTAKKKIESLKAKANGGEKDVTEDVLYMPKHMANPARCSWHIEKDGVIVEKGTGLLKFVRVLDITRDRDLKEWQDYNNMTKAEWIEDYVREEKARYWADDEATIRKRAEWSYQSIQESVKTLEKFNELMQKIDSAAGAMVGHGHMYEKVKETRYKTVNKAMKSDGSIRDGQHFRVVGSFTNGVSRGSVYRIHEKDGRAYAYKLNGKLTKECTGMATASNYWGIYNRDRFMGWINKGALEWVDVVETKEAVEYETVKKVAV